MDWSTIINLVLGTGLVATVVGLLSIRSELKKARAEAEKATAEADTVKITNTEQATRILVQNIVEPLRQELDATRKELLEAREELKEVPSLKREVARLRKAFESVNRCAYADECPVLDELQNISGGAVGRKDGQRKSHIVAGHRAAKRRGTRPSGHSSGHVDSPATDRQSADGSGVQRTDLSGACVAEKAGRRGRDSERPGHQSGKGGDDNEGLC